MFQRLTRDPRALLPALGALVVLATTAVASLGSLLAIPFALWSLVPWAVLFALRRSTLSAWTLGGAGVAALAAELGIRAAIRRRPGVARRRRSRARTEVRACVP